jgi:8-oxo-dGTP pyrophosphatase MutT (NUDIX family)
MEIPGTQDQDNLIRAAGGLVWVDSPNARRLAIVHRSKRYGDEWVLPKGTLEKNDVGPKAAALREVLEETQLPASTIMIEDFHDGISYMTKNGPKVVLFWNFKYIGTTLPVSKKLADESGEVDEIRWVTAEEALSLLRYHKEKSLLKAESVATERKPKISFPGKILAAVRRIYNYNSYKRLQAAYGPFEIQLRRKIEQSERKRYLAGTALQHLDRIRYALETGEIEQGWRHFYEAVRISICMDDDPKSRHCQAIAILNEATQKLSSWRKTTVMNLLADTSPVDAAGTLQKVPADKPQNVKKTVTDYEMSVALQMMHEHFSNTYIKVHRYQYQCVILAMVGLIALGILTISLPGLGDQVRLDNPSLLLSIIAFGALGGVISSIFTISKEWDPKKKIPDLILNSWMTLMRPLVGSISALAIVIFLMSGILNLNMGTVSVYLVLAVAFASGFSERIIIAGVEMIT